MLNKRHQRVRTVKNKRVYKNLTILIADHISHTGIKLEGSRWPVHWLACIAITSFFSIYILQVVAIFMATDDPEKLFECFSVLSFCGMGVYKLTSLFKNRKRWYQLLCQVAELEKKQLKHGETTLAEYETDDENNNGCFSTYISNYTETFMKTSTILVRIYSSTAVIFIMSPFVEHTLRKLHGDGPEGYPHILPVWAALDENFIGYLVTVLCEAVAAIYCVCVHVAFDLTSVGLMIFSCGQFSLLRDYSARIAGGGKNCNICRERDVRAHMRIMKCHGIHSIVVNSMSTLDKLIKHVLGVYFFVATLTLCSVAVRVKTEKMSIMQLLTLLQYMCATLTQLFLFCSYGDAAHNESSVKMGEGPFGAALWSVSPNVRRELTMLGIGMLQPHRLHAGPFNSLDLPTFIQIVRAAYSYYAVLGGK